MKKALIVIDVQKGFLNKLTNKIPEKTRSFVLRKKDNYDLILFTKYVNHSKSNFVKNLKWKGFMEKKETDIVDELKKFTNSKNLFQKDTYGSFVDNRVYTILRKNKIKQVDLTGIDTENCVLTFARDAFDRGFKVRVFKDLCASHSDQKLHLAALKIIKRNIGNVKVSL